MIQLKSILCSLVLSLAVFSSSNLHASSGEQKQVFGDYEIHYMGLTSSFLKEDVAAAVGIQRSRSVGYLSISILHKQPQQALPVPVSGTVTGTIKNLIGQTRELQFKEIKEQDSIYYISTFKFDDEDLYSFHIQSQPENHGRRYDVKFSQRFYYE